MTEFSEVVDFVGLIVDGAGVAIIIVGLLVAFGRLIASGRQVEEPIRRLRHDMGHGILVGLEFLVAADIIRTVAVAPTLESVTVLAIIVLIRTFLSFALQTELEGRVPWRVAHKPQNTD